MISRKKFLQTLSLGGFLPFTSMGVSATSGSSDSTKNKSVEKPVVISTWNLGISANEAAWNVLSKPGGKALDAVEAGARIPEGDPNIHTVGYGGYPDRDGYVTLDACIMNENNECGSVAFLQHIKHPISVARKVMEDTPYIMLVGEGALEFALNKGFKKEKLLTPAAKKAWKKWLKQKHYQPEINVENHDTIGMIALDQAGNLSGACTTSGIAWKMHGRVADSAIIGAGLFVDNEVGGAAATGLGEQVIRTAGSHLVVENMRRGEDPETACRHAVERIIHNNKSVKNFQVGFVALNKDGEFGGYSIHKGFDYAVYSSTHKNELIKSKSVVG